MPRALIHRFEHNGRRFAIDPETCFCFECDEVSWEVLAYYPAEPTNRILHELGGRYDRKELAEVISELEWLRSSKSILPNLGAKEVEKTFDVERGLKKMTVRLPGPHEMTEQTGATALAAARLLLARSQQQIDLHLRFVLDRQVHSASLVSRLCEESLCMARLAGKTMTVSVAVSDLALRKVPEALSGHTVTLALELNDASATGDVLAALAPSRWDTLPRLLKSLPKQSESFCARVIVRPNHSGCGQVAAELHRIGFPVIELDLDSAYLHNDLNPEDMLPGLCENALFYAQSLLKKDYFRLDPIAALFWRIYNGTPVRRSDPAGANELAADEKGYLYPAPAFFADPAMRVGDLGAAEIDEETLVRFENVGSLTTAPCLRCWARNLCGGGTAAVHHRFTGSFREPHEPWCDAQRSWMAASVSAFQTLSAAGINFNRIYSNLEGRGKPSFMTLARAAFRLSIGLRPIEEEDAETLVRWENWSDAAYFLYSDSGILVGSRYDREMDALHPQGRDQEMLLLRKSGAPLGLIRIRPDQCPGAAWTWVYLCDQRDYSASSVRKGFRSLLKQAGAQQEIRRLITPVTPWETGLQEFLSAVGFELAGTEREALFLHGQYHDVQIWALTLD